MNDGQREIFSATEVRAMCQRICEGRECFRACFAVVVERLVQVMRQKVQNLHVCNLCEIG